MTKLMGFIPTLDAGRAKKFYEETLGLKFLYDDNFALVFDIGGVMLRVSRVPEFTPHKFTSLGFEVQDIASTIKELGMKNVMFEKYEGLPQDDLGIMNFGQAKVAWFKDPDGNLLSITELSK